MKETLRKFEDIQDPFNPDNYLTGYIDISQGDNYGQLMLTHINGVECEIQIIYSAPKMHYPFDKAGKFYFESVDSISPMYEKLDGSNIITYKYLYKNKEYLTYKTRLNPVLGKNKFGNFLGMWKDILERNPAIEKTARNFNINFSYELYGILNKHLILYPIRLDAKLLFGLNRFTGDIILPDQFRNAVPVIQRHRFMKPGCSFPELYKMYQEDIESENDYSSLEGIKGSEGRVIYIKDGKSNWKQWKLKASTIFELHCQPGMNKNDITITCYNALENVDLDALSYEFVAELLGEEFSEKEIMSSEIWIKEIIEKVKVEVKRRYYIIEIYNDLEMTLKKNKKELMRKMSESFNKKEIRYVYSIISAYEN